jgi:hypothetical protein
MHVNRLLQIIFILLALTLTGCSGGKDPSTSVKSPGNSANKPRNGETTAATSRLCSLFTAAEIQELLGAPVGEGQVGGPQDSACQWDGSDGGDQSINAQIQLINDTRYWEKHTGAKGYEVLHGIGKEAFVAMSMFGGWEAGALTDKGVVYASLSGGSASRDNAIKFLRTSLERLGLK